MRLPKPVQVLVGLGLRGVRLRPPLIPIDGRAAASGARALLPKGNAPPSRAGRAGLNGWWTRRVDDPTLQHSALASSIK